MGIATLYHASQNKNIKILEPRAESVRDVDEGPVVFASQDKKYVTCFIVPTDDSWAKISQYRIDQHPAIYVMCISDEERFKKLDTGGAIYHLSSKNFYLDRSKSNTEWTSKVSVKPLKKELFNSGLDAMIGHGVQVYFCEKQTLSELYKDPQNIGKAIKILKSMTSENEKRGLENPIRGY